MHPGQNCSDVNKVVQPTASIPIESTKRYLLDMAEEDSVEQAEHCFEMLRKLYINDNVWRDQEQEISNSLKEMKRRKKADEERKKALELEQMANLLANLVKPSQIAVEGDYVMNKNVENQVSNVAQGATGVSINKNSDDKGRTTETT